ncbi:conserved hypothetical protein [Leishmania major strain Friedlin]|uniref:Uncharacterized protein n=1 Tax=Leishmania major TaxID=5664 RepID=Q4Q497_LEIMA|nr:conserved hypothetical protein [Leishmania major strain Friedlin]CAG9580666.1 hypothetical_protein_-_conserved [Leishmania major strain Friedlin]CAJ06166.1 conserved hypothetical protein [Leishmania major strain Friedlin]|eukprot:XP_001685851.1 conserved hypothetical protein [Leishmania major strain Friedlin]
MPVAVSMHACSAWPVSIDFVAFRFFLAGYSVEETVEQLMALRSETPATSPHRSTSSASPSSSRSSDVGKASHAGSASSSQSAAHPMAHRHDRKQQRTPQQRQDSLYAMHKAQQQAEDRRLEVEDENPQEIAVVTAAAALPRKTSISGSASGAHVPTTAAAPSTTTVVDNSNTNASASLSTTVAVSASSAAFRPVPSGAHTRHHRHRHHHHQCLDKSPGGSERKKSCHSAPHSSRSRTATTSSRTATHTSFALPSTLNNADSDASPLSVDLSNFRRFTDDATVAATAAAAPSDAGGGSGARAGGASSSHHLHHVNFGDTKASSSLPQRREKHRKDSAGRHCFFLSESYMKFQRQLQEFEAIGGVGVGSSSLQSRYLFEEVTEQYQVFRELSREEQLGSPYAFLSNYYIPIPVATRLQLLQLYYETDAGVFRWAFGDKLSRFDLPAALSAAREEKVSGTLSAGFGGVAGLGSGGGSSSGAADGGVTAASFWTSRWKGSPGKLAAMDAATVTRLSEQHVDALRRQWENVKHVCVTVAALYRGKGSMCVPLDMPLLTTIQQCFGLRHQQALDYATAAFGFEHRLETRLFEHLHNFNEYGVICSVVASLWCDCSGYFLSGSFRDGCRRLGRLLDEYRILSELHLIVFGETMRPRWQVQLDEVQRVITTSSHVDKNAMASATAAVTATSPVTPSVSGGGGGIATPTTMSAGMLPSFSSGAAGAGGNGHSGGATGGAAADAGNASAYTSPVFPTTGGAFSTNNVHSPFSGNGQYSRPFLMEFPSLMKHLLRVCVALSSNGGVNDGLDIFFTRIYSYLELLSSRTAPAIVSRMMNAAASGASTMTGAAAVVGTGGLASTLSGQLGGSVGGGGAAPSIGASVAPSGRPPLPLYGERVQSDGDLSCTTADSGSAMAPAAASTPLHQGSSSSLAPLTRGGTNLGRPLRSGLPRASSSGHLPRQASGRGGGNAVAMSLLTGASATNLRTGVGGSGGVDEGMAASAPFSYAVSTVVNTSLLQPASILLPLTAAIAAHNSPASGGVASSPLQSALGSRGCASEDEPTDGDADAGSGHGEGAARPTAGGSSPNSSGALSPLTAQPLPASTSSLPSQVSGMVLKVIDKRYLRELCMLLTALPCAWRQLTVLTRDDHMATDKSVSDMMMALKAITQVLMASDDFD